jgi:hypothetical protein
MPLIDVRRVDANQRLRGVAFAVALLAVMVEFAVPRTTDADPGGDVFLKYNPGTYLLVIAVFMVLLLPRPAGSGLIRFLHDKPELALLNTLFLFCVLYSISNVGFNGAAVHIESYLSAGLLAVVLEGGTASQKRALSWTIVGFCALSIIISIGEGAILSHGSPLSTADASIQELAPDPDDVRAAGLFSNPATAALVTSMAVFLLLRMSMNGLLKTVLFVTFLIGLLGFGGDAAPATVITLILLTAFGVLLRGLVTRRLSLTVVGVIGATIVILPPLILMFIMSTDSGDPTLVHLSAESGSGAADPQWLVLNHLDLRDLLFGTSPPRLDVLQSQISPGRSPVVIGNLWLRTFLDLGAICSAVLLGALGFFAIYLGRVTAHPLGWLLLTAAILINATSDLNGPQNVDLVAVTACMTAMNGYARTPLSIFPRARVLTRLRGPAEGQMAERPGGGARTHVNLAGQQS